MISVIRFAASSGVVKFSTSRMWVLLIRSDQSHALYRRWESYQEANGLEPKVSLYELRHTFVSVESSVLTDSQLKMLVGHSKNMDTSGVYRHELQGQREDLAAATTAAFQKAQG